MALPYLKPAINLIRFTMYKMADTKMTKTNAGSGATATQSGN